MNRQFSTGGIVAAIASFWLAAMPAQAQAPALQVFAACDGYGAPSRSGDGMTMQANTMGIFKPDPGYGTTLQGRVSLGQAGAAACDQALASPLLLPTYWQRRVSLLRAKAFHLIAAGQREAGLAELARARAAVTASDPYFDRTMGLGFDFLQAWMIRDGDQAGAARLAIETWRKRPYNNETVASALIAMGPGAAPQDFRSVLTAGATVYPHLIEILYQDAYEEGRFADAVALYKDVRINREPVNRLPEMYSEGVPGGGRLLAERHRDEVSMAVSAGEQAYMLEALGRSAEAQAVLQAVRTRLDILIQPQPKPRLRANGKPVYDPMRKPTQEANVRLATEISAVLTAWTDLIRMRQDARTDPARVLASVRAQPPAATRAVVDMLDVLAAHVPAADRAEVADWRDRSLRVVKDRLLRRRTERAELADLFRGLPEAEVAGRLEAYNKPRLVGAKGQFWPVTPSAVVVTYYGYESSLSMVQEQTLLMAAEHARAKGFKGFIVLDRKDVQQGASSNPYGGVADMHIGYSSYLLVLPVDPAVLPPGFETSGWRVLSADTVYNALYPLYGPGARKKK